MTTWESVQSRREFGGTRHPAMPDAGRFDVGARDFRDLVSQLDV